VKLRRDRKAVSKPKPLYRYALGNHLGSTSLEVDEDGKVVSYEEYHPYGTTAYRAVRSGIDVDVNRYRFTGMERDEETGLAQHGWRYFASWLGRWGSADPIGLGDGVNRYAYCGGNPVGFEDTRGSSRAPAKLTDITNRLPKDMDRVLREASAISKAVEFPDIHGGFREKNPEYAKPIRIKSLTDVFRINVSPNIHNLSRISASWAARPTKLSRDVDAVLSQPKAHYVDPYLAMVIALRESGRRSLRNSSRMVNSFSASGLDNLGLQETVWVASRGCRSSFPQWNRIA